MSGGTPRTHVNMLFRDRISRQRGPGERFCDPWRALIPATVVASWACSGEAWLSGGLSRHSFYSCHAGPFLYGSPEGYMPRCLLFDAMSYRTRGAGRRGITSRGVATLGAIAGLAMLLAGCGGATLTPSAGAGTGGGAHEGAGTGSRSSTSGPLLNPAREAPGTGAMSSVTAGALFGGNAALVPEEAALGRRLAIIRVYYRIGETFPQRMNQKYMAAGSTLLVSLDTAVSRNGPSYAAIAAGREDGFISSFL